MAHSRFDDKATLLTIDDFANNLVESLLDKTKANSIEEHLFGYTAALGFVAFVFSLILLKKKKKELTSAHSSRLSERRRP